MYEDFDIPYFHIQAVKEIVMNKRINVEKLKKIHYAEDSLLSLNSS